MTRRFLLDTINQTKNHKPFVNTFWYNIAIKEVIQIIEHKYIN